MLKSTLLLVKNTCVCAFYISTCVCLCFILIVLLTCRHLTQFEELELLKEFEKRETNFTSKYRTKKKERGDLEVKVN